MTHKEFQLRKTLITHTFDLGEITTDEYFRQMEMLAEQYGEEYEEEL